MSKFKKFNGLFEFPVNQKSTQKADSSASHIPEEIWAKFDVQSKEIRAKEDMKTFTLQDRAQKRVDLRKKEEEFFKNLNSTLAKCAKSLVSGLPNAYAEVEKTLAGIKAATNKGKAAQGSKLQSSLELLESLPANYKTNAGMLKSLHDFSRQIDDQIKSNEGQANKALADLKKTEDSFKELITGQVKIYQAAKDESVKANIQAAVIRNNAELKEKVAGFKEAISSFRNRAEELRQSREAEIKEFVSKTATLHDTLRIVSAIKTAEARIAKAEAEISRSKEAAKAEMAALKAKESELLNASFDDLLSLVGVTNDATPESEIYLWDKDALDYLETQGTPEEDYEVFEEEAWKIANNESELMDSLNQEQQILFFKSKKGQEINISLEMVEILDGLLYEVEEEIQEDIQTSLAEIEAAEATEVAVDPSTPAEIQMEIATEQLAEEDEEVKNFLLQCVNHTKKLSQKALKKGKVSEPDQDRIILEFLKNSFTAWCGELNTQENALSAKMWWIGAQHQKYEPTLIS